MPVGITKRSAAHGEKFAFEVVSTLNGDSATLTVFEDTNGDGNSDNVDEFTLVGGREKFQNVNTVLNSGNEIWYELNLVDDSDITTAGQIEKFEVIQ